MYMEKRSKLLIVFAAFVGLQSVPSLADVFDIIDVIEFAKDPGAKGVPISKLTPEEISAGMAIADKKNSITVDSHVTAFYLWAPGIDDKQFVDIDLLVDGKLGDLNSALDKQGTVYLNFQIVAADSLATGRYSTLTTGYDSNGNAIPALTISYAFKSSGENLDYGFIRYASDTVTKLSDLPADRSDFTSDDLKNLWVQISKNLK